MATNQNETARSGKPETLNEVLIRLGYLKPEQATQDDILVAILTRIQRMHVPDRYFLMWEHWDWLVVLQCMQDHNLFKSNPKRPPLAQRTLPVGRRHVGTLCVRSLARSLSYAQ